ncbi:YcaO-like family protein [Herbaspirillum rhizosphaerae]|uniref:YcaO-like family protein n=1 Tax=Herbaspirillum rhizosphaerae TaxID=346179 RepID=UPI000AFDF556|nr:YcaO-like family protein [Herbaspirillum rhizosphaerae]
MSLTQSDITYSGSLHERSLATSDAIKIAWDIAERHQLDIQLKEVGKSPSTISCRITDKSGWYTHGNGKGIGQQSLASALFEALEHYFYYNENIYPALKFQLLDLDASDTYLVGSCPDFSRILSKEKVSFGRLSFHRVGGNSENILFPAFLTNPKYISRVLSERDALSRLALMRYSSNSGTAAGANEHDAVLHGLLEIIERDSLGIELLRVVIRKNPYQQREIDRDSLSEYLCALLNDIEVQTNGTIIVWAITTDLGVPSVLAALIVKNQGDEKYFGSGASLSWQYAIERAALEAMQVFHCHIIYRLKKPISKLVTDVKLPLYSYCQLQAGQFHPRGGTKKISSKELELFTPSIEKLSPAQQINLIVDRLSIRGIEVFSRSITNNGFSLAQVIAPKLERFHLVTSGSPVAPGSRGLRVLAD